MRLMLEVLGMLNIINWEFRMEIMIIPKYGAGCVLFCIEVSNVTDVN